MLSAKARLMQRFARRDVNGHSSSRRERGVGGEGSRKALFPVIVSPLRLKGVSVCSFSLTLVTAGRLCLYLYIYTCSTCACVWCVADEATRLIRVTALWIDLSRVCWGDHQCLCTVLHLCFQSGGSFFFCLSSSSPPPLQINLQREQQLM